MKKLFRRGEILKQGRISLFLIAIVTLAMGLFLHQWWWKIGAIIILIQFVEAYFRYRTLD